MAGGNDVLAKKYVEFAQRGVGSVQAMIRDLGKEATRAQGRAQLLNKHLKDGTYQKAANQLAAIRRQYAAMSRAAQFQDLVAEHGRFGASLTLIKERMQGVSRAAGVGFGIVTAATMGWVTAGTAGTVEAYRLQNAFWLLSHGIAGVFKPTIDDATAAVYRAAYWFRGLSGNQQETLRTAVLWTAGILGGALALNLAVKAVAGLRAAYLLLLPVIDALITKQTYLNIAQRMGGARMMLMRGLAATGIGLGLHALGEAARPSGDEKHRARYGEGIEMALGSATRGLEGIGRIIVGEGWLWGSLDTDKKGSWIERANLEEAEKWGVATEAQKKRLEELRTEKPRTDVTPFSAGFAEIGSAWDRASNAILELDDPLVRNTDALKELTKSMEYFKEKMGFNPFEGIMPKEKPL